MKKTQARPQYQNNPIKANLNQPTISSKNPFDYSNKFTTLDSNTSKYTVNNPSRMGDTKTTLSKNDDDPKDSIS